MDPVCCAERHSAVSRRPRSHDCFHGTQRELWLTSLRYVFSLVPLTCLWWSAFTYPPMKQSKSHDLSLYYIIIIYYIHYIIFNQKLYQRLILQELTT